MKDAVYQKVSFVNHIEIYDILDTETNIPMLESKPSGLVRVAFENLMIQGILQFALRIAFRCVLHRHGNQDIHR